MSDMPAPPTVESSATEPRHSLWQAVARSVRDNVIAEFVVQAVRLGGFVVLARALGPDEFGVFRVLLVVAVLTTLSNESGIPDALVQRKEITPAHEATAWWLSMLAAFSAVTILYFAAPIIATAMGMPKLTDGARLLCLPILLDATAVVPSARLRRALNFTALAAADIVAEIAFIGVALFVLWHKMPVWVLPAGLAARFTVHAIAIWLANPQLPRGWPTLQAARDFARFSTAAWGSRIVYVLSSNADYLLVGRLLGSSALGFYGMAWDLLRFVPDRLHRVAGRVTFPAFCQLQDDQKALARGYLDFFDYMARVVLPVGDAGGAPRVALRVGDRGRKNRCDARRDRRSDDAGSRGVAAGAGLPVAGALQRDGTDRQGVCAGRGGPSRRKRKRETGAGRRGPYKHDGSATES
jgi:O-antigen/teichoic acid export membrane protein